MTTLIAGLVLFLGVHSISIVSVQWRDRMATKLGQTGWKAVYSVIVLIGLFLIINGYSAARLDPTVLYNPPIWMRHITLLLMLPVFPLLLAAYLPGRIQMTTKHPMLIAVKLWALSHLLSNGTLADVILFGSFLAWAVIDRISLKRRTPRPIPNAPRSKWNDIVAVGGGFVFYLVFMMWLHRVLIGVPPISM